MTSPDEVIWLKERTSLGILSPGVLNAIAQVLETQVVPPDTSLVQEDTPPEALYIVLDGQLESNASNQSKPALPCGFLPGSVINLQELLLDELTPLTITTLTECHLWVVPLAQFRALVSQYPEITQAFSRQLAQELAQMTSAFIARD